MTFHRTPDAVQAEIDALDVALRGRFGGWCLGSDGDPAVDVIQRDGTPKRYAAPTLRQALRLAREGEGLA